MTAVTKGLHHAFIQALNGRVIEHDEVATKPLHVALASPLPYQLRVYLYSLVMGGTVRKRELKVNLRVPGQRVGEYASFDFSDDRLVLLMGYHPPLDVFVLWDASLYPRFKHGGNVQVKEETVVHAAINGMAEQRRRLASGTTEVIFACRPDTLARAMSERVAWTGGVSE